MRYELLVGLRYTRAKRRNHFISFISLISMAGIALGVAALIVVLSVMNGFQKELRTRILGVASHVQISGVNNRLADWPAVAKSAALGKILEFMRLYERKQRGGAPRLNGSQVGREVALPPATLAIEPVAPRAMAQAQGAPGRNRQGVDAERPGAGTGKDVVCGHGGPEDKWRARLESNQ